MSRILRKHGLSHTPEYRAWQTMVRRCTNPADRAYPRYGGRGITVCARWLNDPAAFIADMGRKPSPRHELDREKNDQGYFPGNCRWVLRKVNDRNRRSNRWLVVAGERRTLVEWSELSGITADAIAYRLEAGWTPEQAITTPARAKLPNGEGAAKAAIAKAAWRASRKLPAGVKAKRGRYVARIRTGKRERFLGSYDTPEEAHAAYLKAKENP